MEREAKDGTIYREVGPDQWEAVARRARDGKLYKSLGNDQWELMDNTSGFGLLSDEQKAKNAQAPFAGLEGVDVLEGAGRVLDYPRGLVSTGLASLSGVAGKEDWMNAIKGKAPTSAQYMERAGVPAGPAIPEKVPLVGGISARDVGGFAADVIQDPLTLGSKAIKGLRPIGAKLESAGEKLYKSGLKNVDKDLAVKGKAPVSDILLQERKTGSMGKLAGDAEEINRKTLAARDELYKQASDAGAIVDMTAAVKGARQKLAKLRDNPGTRELADKLEEFLNKYEGEGFVDIQSVSDWKSALYDSLPESAFSGGRLKGPAKAFEATLARDFKKAIETAADGVAPGLGKKISQANEKMGSILSSKKSFARETKKEITPNALTQVDAMWSLMGGGAGGALGGGPGAIVGTAAAYGAKNAVKKMNTTAGRTKSGLLLKDVGSSGLVDSVARQGLIKSTKKKNEKRD